ncbi:MAG: PepSY-like domain-containing protein [Bacteroidales bacterium]|nr:PepSY-like domain-containing protein [Bacteroidales bacterium]
MAFALCLNACKDEHLVGFDLLPENAKNIINEHFDKDDILLVNVEKEALVTEYEVKFKDGTEIDFDKDGNLKKIDCQQKQVPDALIPEAVLEYVKANYPSSFITEWGRDDLRWKAELDNGLELLFNRNYQFVGIDD